VTNIQAHVGGAATDAAADIGAQAFATGDHLAFAGAPDLHTAAHEAAHAIQQRGGVQLLGGVGRPGDPYEQHADAVADRVVQGQSAESLLDQFARDAHRDDQPATETTAAQPAVQRAPPPGQSGEQSATQDTAVHDQAGKVRQLADNRDPSNPSNTLSAKEMYETWRNLWSSRNAQARRRMQELKDRMRSEDPLGYAEKKERYDSGLRDALGPEYDAAENQMALCSAELSSMEEVLNWLEGHETAGRHVTLDQVSHHALEWANARDKYGGVLMTLFLLALPVAVAGAGSGPPRMGPAAEGAAAEGAAADGIVAEEAGAAEAGATEGPAATRPGTLSQFTRTTVDEVVASAGRLRPGGQIGEGARAIAKKLGHAQTGGYTSAFAGVKPTQASAEAIIRNTLEDPVRTFYGDAVIDVYNTAGQGVRFDRATNTFNGFLEAGQATQ
jgi:hypothetical protein